MIVRGIWSLMKSVGNADWLKCEHHGLARRFKRLRKGEQFPHKSDGPYILGPGLHQQILDSKEWRRHL